MFWSTQYYIYRQETTLDIGYCTAARKYEFYFRIIKTIFYERAQRVWVSLLTRENKHIPKPSRNFLFIIQTDCLQNHWEKREMASLVSTTRVSYECPLYQRFRRFRSEFKWKVRFSFFWPDYSGSPLEVVHIFRSEYSDRNSPFHFWQPVLCPYQGIR